MKKKIVIVEDSEDQAEWLRGKLGEMYPESTVEHIRTESEFQTKLDGIESTVPDLVLMDVMLRWADPAPDAPPRPPDIAKQGFHRAGLRCRESMRQREALRKVPIILVSVLEEIDFDPGELPPDVTLVTKESNHTGLANAIESVLGKPAAII
ncbi:MAG TPA: hypothetical protein VEQ63_10185 [Bryobacteraceae bacterium]|nr:hypothetical protein [Bryobacteraceae bacterium]